MVSYFFVLGCLLILVILAVLGWMYRDLLQIDVSTPMVSRVKESNVKFVPPISHKKMPQKQESFLNDENTIPLIFEEESEKLNEMNLFESSEQKEEKTSDFSIQSVHFRTSEDKKTVLIEGILKNISNRGIKLPEKIYALGYGADGTIVFEKEIYLPGNFLNPQMEQAFFGTYGPIREEIQWVDVVLKR